MNPSEYQKAAMRTECRQDVSRLRILGNVCLDGQHAAVPMLTPVRVFHACVGLSSEVGEITSIVQNWLFYGRAVDVAEFKAEIGDVLWYVAQLCETLGLDMADVMAANIAKLKARYPEKFDDVIERDKAAEKVAVTCQKSRFSDPKIVQDGHGFGHLDEDGTEVD